MDQVNARTINLAHEQARRFAVQCVQNAPSGFVVRVEAPKRSLDQNAMLWPLLECFARQLEWPVNGRMQKLESDEWKYILTAAFRNETQRIAMGLNGGMVILGMRTSKMTKQQFSEFIEFIIATAADRGVDLSMQSE